MPQTQDTALLFPGQGSHSEGMEEPYRSHPLLVRGIDLLGFDPFTDLSRGGTRAHQPALYLVGMAIFDQAGHDSETVTASAGHSLGEYAALTAAGAISFDDGVRLVKARAEAMQEAADVTPGGMVAMLGGDEDAVRALASDLELTVANDNAPGQLVLSGAMDAVDAAIERARGEADAKTRKLEVAGAFHSPLMAPAADKLAAALAETEFSEPAFPVISNGSAQPFADVRAELAENLLQGVRWRETLITLQGMGTTTFVECAPGGVLKAMVKRTLGRKVELV